MQKENREQAERIASLETRLDEKSREIDRQRDEIQELRGQVQRLLFQVTSANINPAR